MNDVDPADAPISRDTIRHLPLFAGLSETDLDTLYQMTRTLTVSAGHVLMEEGSLPESAYVIVDGEVEVTTRRGDQEVLLAVRRHGELIGEISLLEQAPRVATVRARTESCLLEVTQQALETLIACSKAARWAILAGVASRLRSTQQLLDQNVKLAQLGELAANLAHEVNNPAAAARRSVAQLRDVLETRDRVLGEVADRGLHAAQHSALDQLHAAAVRHAASQLMLDTLVRAELEDETLAWLEDRDVPRAWELAEILVSYGWTTSELSQLVDSFDDELGVLVAQLAAYSTQAYGLLAEIGRIAEAITTRVRAVKEYAFLDQAPVQPVDIHHGLDTTLVMLRHKIGPGVAIRREYSPDLPRIEAYGSELNQVWTNLIDNALDAIGEQGELVLRTSRMNGSVQVEVRDTGSGIPAELLPRIFEAGVTTKPPGEGSGRGLHIARNIVEDKHRGQIQVTSEAGETVFQVTLPIELPRG